MRRFLVITLFFAIIGYSPIVYPGAFDGYDPLLTVPETADEIAAYDSSASTLKNYELFKYMPLVASGSLTAGLVNTYKQNQGYEAYQQRKPREAVNEFSFGSVCHCVL